MLSIQAIDWLFVGNLTISTQLHTRGIGWQ
jgi:hypothetical protein